MQQQRQMDVRGGVGLERWTLAAFLLFTAASVAGYASFGLHPRLLASRPEAAAFYSTAFVFFPRAHVLLAFAVLALVLAHRVGAAWIPAFASCYAISLASELAGTTVGLPFGPYHYTDGLGIKWLGHVPVLIPLSWFFMALPSFAIARAALPADARRGPAGRGLVILAGSLVLLAWDLALDPAMSWLTKYWVWQREGTYYGMPLLNLFGWYTTGLALMAAFVALGADRWVERLPTRWLAGFYVANLLLPLGMLAAAGAWFAVLVSLAAVAGSLAVPALAAPQLGRVTAGATREAA